MDMIEEDDPQYISFKKHVEAQGYKVFPMSARWIWVCMKSWVLH